MLSALIQSESAIIAVVVTLSLVAVQLTASSFSSEITAIFRNSKDLWIVMVSYITAILFSLYVLYGVGRSPQDLSLGIRVGISSSLGTYCFIALVPYIYRAFTMLDHKNIVRKLGDGIAKDTLLNRQMDPFYPILYRAKCSIRDHDILMTRFCMQVVVERINHILETSEMIVQEEDKIYELIVSHLRKISDLAIKERDEDSANEIISSLAEMSSKAVKRSFFALTNKLAFLVGEIGNDAARQDLLFIVERSVEILNMTDQEILKLKNQDQRDREQNSRLQIIRSTVRKELEKISETEKEKGRTNIPRMILEKYDAPLENPDHCE